MVNCNEKNIVKRFTYYKRKHFESGNFLKKPNIALTAEQFIMPQDIP